LCFPISSFGADITLETRFKTSPEQLKVILAKARKEGVEVKISSGVKGVVPKATLRAVADHNAGVRADAANKRAAVLKTKSPRTRMVEMLAARDPGRAIEYYDTHDEMGKPRVAAEKAAPNPNHAKGHRISSARLGGTAAATSAAANGTRAFYLTAGVTKTAAALNPILLIATAAHIGNEAGKACEGVKCVKDYFDHGRQIKMDQMAASRAIALTGSNTKKREPRLNEFVFASETDKCIDDLLKTYYAPGSNEDPNVKLARVSSTVREL
jgi:hypothetical protein